MKFSLPLRHLSGLTLFLLVLLLTPVGASAEKLAAPQQVIQDISDSLQGVLSDNGDLLKSDPAYVYRLANEVLVPHIDFARVSSLVLGKHWRRASVSEREAFAREFRRLLVRTYSTAFHEFDMWEIRYQPLRMKAGSDDLSVQTKVIRPGAAPVAVVYRMHLKEGRWMAYDVKIEGISLVTNYRSGFARDLRKGDMTHLIQRLSDLNERRLKRVAVK
ncbi:MAG: ABC transporter substrate-binding protein [Candidatus Sedimenticola sp. (ex Thyasira tokunagai)]